MKKIICLILGISGLYSCKPVFQLYYGIHQPRIESLNSIEKYQRKKGIDGTINLMPKDAASFRSIMNTLKETPDLIAYTREGYLIRYKDTLQCNAPGFDFSKLICSAYRLRIDSTQQLAAALKGFVPLTAVDQQRLQEEAATGYEYTVVLYWTKYTGRLNKNHTRIWKNNLEKSTDCKVRLLMVNMDLNERFFKK